MENKGLIIYPSKGIDVIDLKDNLRQADINEITALGSNSLNSLLSGYLFSEECYTAFINNKVCGMFGYVKQTNCIWFLGSDLINSVPKEWITTGKQYINRFLQFSPILKNTVSTDNKLHIKWLKRMGAKFSAPYLINDHYFQDFYILQPTSEPEKELTRLEV